METSNMKKETLERKKVKKKMSKAQMQLAIIKKKQCDAKALTIVEQLLEPEIDSQWLLSNLKYINKSHMEDVIEERAIIKLCGYVLCNNALTVVIGQRYHISTKNNKVYDVSQRKNFCSSRCYGAYNYLLEQMFTSPLWLRDKEEIPEFKILPAKDELEKSMPGDEIHVRDINTPLNPESKDEYLESNTTCKSSESTYFNKSLKDDIQDKGSSENSQTVNEIGQASNITEGADVFKEEFSEGFEECKNVKNTSINLEDKSDIIEKCTNDCTVKETTSLGDNTLFNFEVVEDTTNLNNDIISSYKDANEDIKNDGQNELLQVIEKDKNTSTIEQNVTINNNDNVQEVGQTKRERHKQKKPTKELQSRDFYNLAMHIEQNVREWVTEDTICLLSGEEDVKNRLLENVFQHDRYLHLCKKLNRLQLEDEKDDHGDTITNSLKPLPHLSALQEEGKKIELKVKAFYKGSMAIETPGNTTEKEEQNDFTPVFPLTDAHAPKMLRRRIFLDKLNRILPDLLRALANNKLPQCVYSNERSALIKVLVNTFSLSAGNIIFKSAEWTLMGLIIIKMLSMIDPHLKTLLSTKQASMYISMILMSYKLDSNYLDRFVMELINNTEISNVDNATSVAV